jgi:parvulin-like peptidyl-prolyl isomerase
MRASPRTSLAIALLLSLGGLPACESCKSGTGAPATPDAGHRRSATLTREQSEKVLARVGERTITLGDFAAAIENMDAFDRLRYQSPERRKELLDEMINVELLAREAEAKGWDKDPVTEQEIRAILRDAVIAETHKGAPLPADVPASDVRAYYEAHKADFADPERRRLSVIVLPTEAAAAEVLPLARKAKAASEWGELVRSRSVDPQAKANVPVDLAGDLGIVSPPGDTRGENTRVPPEVRKAAFELAAPGDVLDRAVKAKGGFYLVRLTQKLEAHERPYEAAERTVRIKLSQDLMREKEKAALADLRRKYPVEVDEAALSTVRADWPDAGSNPRPPPR